MKCPACGGETKRNGRTSSGRTRWRCKSCGASTTQRYDDTPKLLRLFLRWLLSKGSQEELGMPARTFRQLTSRFWSLWPVLPICDEVHHVVYMDGLWLGRAHRPGTRVQRCAFHVFEQVKRCTTTRPKLQAGVELYRIAKDLLHVADQDGAARWLVSFNDWCVRWGEFLKERTVVDGRKQYKHERLRKARRSLESLCRDGTLFTFLEDGIAVGGPVPATSNKSESNNARIREVLRNHRGMPIDRRIKAGFWWCYMNSEAPMPYSEMAKAFPDDELIMEWRRRAAGPYADDEVSRWGAGIVWAEFHSSGPWRSDYE